MVQVKDFLHSAQTCSPSRIFLAGLGVAFQIFFWSLFLQCGQTGPSGHQILSRYSRAAKSVLKRWFISSSVKSFGVFSAFASFVFMPKMSHGSQLLSSA